MRRLALLLGVVALAAACGDKIQFAEPPRSSLKSEATSRPSRPGPASDGRIASHGKTGDGAALGGGGVDPFADPEDAGKPAMETSGKKVSPDEVWFSGKVTLGPGTKKLPDTYTIYVMAGPPPRGSPPVLSRRYQKPTFPFEFELRQKDIPFSGVSVDRPLVLGVIISEKGPVMVREGLYERSVLATPQAPKSKGITLELKF